MSVLVVFKTFEFPLTFIFSFYVWPIEDTDKAIIFVREWQFAQLLREVQKRFPHFHIDPKEAWFRQIRLVTAFPDHQRLRPRYLGRSKSKDDYDKLLFQRVPKQRPFSFPPNEPECQQPPDDDDVADFNDICETAIDLNRQKQRGKTRKQEAKVLIQANLNKQLKRAQRYFGIRKRLSEGDLTNLLEWQDPC